MFIDKDGNKLKADIPLQIGDEMVGPDFLKNATAEMLEERGITRVVDPQPKRKGRRWVESAEEMKLRLLDTNSKELLGYLSRTDWAIIRKSELGIAPPEEITKFRDECRAAALNHEETISALETEEELDAFIGDKWPRNPGDVDPNATE